MGTAVVFDVRSALVPSAIDEAVDAIILCLGYRVERGFLKDIGLNVIDGGIEVDGMMRSTAAGVYVVGDAARPREGVNLRLIATGIAQAAIAINHACHELDPQKHLVPPHSSNRRL